MRLGRAQIHTQPQYTLNSTAFSIYGYFRLRHGKQLSPTLPSHPPSIRIPVYTSLINTIRYLLYIPVYISTVSWLIYFTTLTKHLNLISLSSNRFNQLFNIYTVQCVNYILIVSVTYIQTKHSFLVSVTYTQTNISNLIQSTVATQFTL
jgi:hypothetical protein